ncbi:hypothetical protein HBN50_12810 [Halobacteriovorax sp. GB3]|uniref:hypothetical protein n=1 Tax=Halobacteriovorax sp. GB3 TaxID=2719615 RepID=UPI002361551C|nr:hypothetical protein [Halobacteriovorax sp. GB3]MDD0853985.1 hypothetical protein [Halobacteriovorax sp. GB3]
MTDDQVNILIGAGIGFFTSILTTYLFSVFSNEKRSRVLMSSIRGEISCLWDRYYNSVGNDLEKLKNSKKTELMSEFYASRDYFSIYDSVAHELPIIKDKDSISKIIRVYTEMRGHLDSWAQYNSLFLRWQENIKNSYTSEQNDLSRVYFQGVDRNLVDVLNLYKNDVLFKELTQIKGDINELKDSLDKKLEENFFFAVLCRPFK